MRRTENQCCSCGLPCLGSSCPNRNVPIYICDKCGYEYPAEELYEYDCQELCRECLLEEVPRITP